jgi:hypothetical protein
LFVFALIFCFPVYVFFSAFLFWHPSLSFTFVCFCLYLFSDIIVIVVFVDVLLLLYHCFVVCFLLLLSDIFLVRFFTFPRCDDHLLSPVVIMRVIIFVSTFERPRWMAQKNSSRLSHNRIFRQCFGNRRIGPPPSRLLSTDHRKWDPRRTFPIRDSTDVQNTCTYLACSGKYRWQLILHFYSIVRAHLIFQNESWNLFAGLSKMFWKRSWEDYEVDPKFALFGSAKEAYSERCIDFLTSSFFFKKIIGPLLTLEQMLAVDQGTSIPRFLCHH